MQRQKSENPLEKLKSLSDIIVILPMIREEMRDAFIYNLSLED